MNVSDSLADQLALATQEVVAMLSESQSLLIKLPDPSSVDLTMQELGALVVQTSNNYAQIARISGILSASAKIERGKFQRAYKSAPRIGSNDAARESGVWLSTSDLHKQSIDVEALATIADKLETAARIASESARKIYDRTLANYTGSHRADTVNNNTFYEDGLLSTDLFGPKVEY